MTLDVFFYPVIHFCRVILYVWRSPFVVSMLRRVPCVVLIILCISPDATLLIISYLFHLFKTLSSPLWRGCLNTLAASTSRVTLICHGRRARPSSRAMAPSPSKNNLGLTSPRWRMFIDFFKKHLKDS